MGLSCEIGAHLEKFVTLDKMANTWRDEFDLRQLVAIRELGHTFALQYKLNSSVTIASYQEPITMGS